MPTLSIINNTNRAVSSSDVDLSSVRKGSLLKFGNDSVFYTVATVLPFMYIRDFILKDPKSIIVDGNIGVEIATGDSLDISFKEYELVTALPINRGKGYAVNDLLYVDSGLPGIDVVTGTKQLTCFKVTQVDDQGKIVQVSLEAKGKYIIEPNFESPVIGGKGKDAVFQLTYKTTDVRAIIERSIERIEQNGNETVLFLNFPLPNGIQTGKLSTNKWEVFLTSNYAGESKINTPYVISKDFTPIYGIPLISKNSLNMEMVANQAIMALERKIKELEDKLSSR